MLLQMGLFLIIEITGLQPVFRVTFAIREIFPNSQTGWFPVACCESDQNEIR